jgi:hypothetical protein
MQRTLQRPNIFTTFLRGVGDWIVEHRIGLQQLALVAAFGLMAYALLPHHAAAQGIDGQITSAADQALKIVKALWAFVFIACIFALIYYLVAYFTQGLFPQLWQPVSGNWGRNALMLGIGANIIMGILIGAAEAAKGGWAGN